jgi:hypothetical protein
MAKMLGLDLGTNSIGWALIDTDTNTIARRRIACRQAGRNTRISGKNSLALIDRIKRVWPVCIHILLAVLLAGSLLMALIQQKDFQFWFNLTITVLLGWVAAKK